ncbi:MAG: protein kinase [Pirellulales bacterium]|nr:protein kinase [Pirellulales bacterium]
MTEGAPSQPNLTEADLSGRELGGYRVLRRLGRGAMAAVYLAEQTSLKRQVAIKVLLPHLAADSSYVERFRLEAQAAASLVHANIVQVHEVGECDGWHYIAQEYVAGVNLKDYLRREGPLALTPAVSVMRQVVAALAKAASHGIVHRDIKPENIMLSPAGDVKVADFGLARIVSDATVNLTQVGVTLGTPLYMSPEQVEGRPLDPRSDQYSFGVTCYQMLAGRPPFEADTALGVAVQHLRTTPRPLGEIRTDLPPAFCDLVMRMLAKSPDERFTSGRELLKQLGALNLPGVDADWAAVADIDDAPTSGQVTAATQHLQTVLTRQLQLDQRPRRRAWVLFGLIALGLCAGAAVGWRTRAPFVLAGADPTRSHVERRPNVIDQLFYATALNTEEGWLAIHEYFPEEDFYIRLADQQLARLYLQEGDYARAEPIFREFAGLDPAEESFRAFGLAGLAVVYSLEGDPRRSAEELTQLLPLAKHLDDQMRRLVDGVIRRNQNALSQQAADRWRELLAEPTPVEDG